MEKNKLNKLEAFKLSSFSLHNVKGGGDVTCQSGSTTCSGATWDSDNANGDSHDITFNPSIPTSPTQH